MVIVVFLMDVEIGFHGDPPLSAELASDAVNKSYMISVPIKGGLRNEASLEFATAVVEFGND
ncbi:hypothetical protein AGMMS49992_08040 [Clostridia bacterium]|nr:hypothetical protein AGMMS49992_08040 [Clostridia bacterium]